MGAQYIVRTSLKEIDADLKLKFKAPPIEPLRWDKQETDLVARLRDLAVASSVSSATIRNLTVLVADFFRREARLLRPGYGSHPFWLDLNATPEVVARVFVEMVRENPKNLLGNLPRGPGAKAGTGREGNFNGWLFQRYALNHVELHKDLRGIAGGHVTDLNQRLRSSSGLLYDPHEVRLDLAGRFGAPQRATDFWLTPRRQGKEVPALSDVDPDGKYHWEEFMDCAYVSPLLVPRQPKPVYWTIAVGLEVKRPAAAEADLSRQVGEMLGRMQDSDVLRMTLDGVSAPVTVPTRAFVFVPESRWLVGATRSLEHAPEYDFVLSRSGGYSETYLRMRVRFDTGPLDRLSGLLFRVRL